MMFQVLKSFIGQTLFHNLPEYSNNENAKIGGIPRWGLYRTGGISLYSSNTVSIYNELLCIIK